MKKKIKLILKEDYLNLGKKNSIIHVNRGYGMNYLLPNKICEVATKKQIKHLNMFAKIKNEKAEKSKILFLNFIKKLNLVSKITIGKKVGENYNLFGKINDKDIINKINFHSNTEIEKKQIYLNDIKKIGILSTTVQLPYCEKIEFKTYIYPINI